MMHAVSRSAGRALASPLAQGTWTKMPLHRRMLQLISRPAIAPSATRCTSLRCMANAPLQCSLSTAAATPTTPPSSSSSATAATDAPPATATPAAEQSSHKNGNSSNNGNDSHHRTHHRQNHPPPPFPPPTLLVRVLSTLALLPVLYLIHDGVASVSSVRGTSMQPTLNPRAVAGMPSLGGNDVVLVWKWGKARFQYKRGQVVVLTSPRNPHIHTTKRLIALEGDWVRDPRDPMVWLTVPRGRVWIEGDNELTSVDDSRQLGPIPMGLLGGRVTHVLWPPSRMGAVRTTLDPAGGPQRVRTREQVRDSYKEM